MSTENKSALAKSLIARYDRLYGAQSNFRMLWEDASKYVAPSYGGIITQQSPGEQQTIDIYDSTAVDSAMVMAAGLMSSLVPSGELWFRYTPKPGAPEELAAWLDDCTHRAAQALHASNFYLGIHEDFLDLARFSTSAMFVEEKSEREKDQGRVLSFSNVPVGTFVIDESADGIVDTVIRKFKYSARQAAQKWGVENLPKRIQDLMASGREADQDTQFEFLHAIYPRREGEFSEGIASAERRPVASVYIEIAGCHVVEEGGYYEMPIAVSRLIRGNNEVYGRGPSDQVMPEIKLVNKMEKTLLLAMERMVSPPWLMPEDSAYRPDNRPGGITFWDTSNPNNKPEQLIMQNRVDIGEDKIERKRDVIRRAFFVDMFQMLSNPDAMRRQKTAFEVEQLVQERLVLFSPMFARIVQEKLNPVLQRVFNAMLRSSAFAPPPEVNGVEMEYEIDYVSKIALAIKAAQNGALVTMMQIVGQMAQFDPNVAHIINWPKAARGVARNTGLPVDWQRSESEVEEILEAQAEAQQMAEMEQAVGTADKLAGAAQKLGPGAQQGVLEALNQ